MNNAHALSPETTNLPTEYQLEELTATDLGMVGGGAAMTNDD